MSVIKVYIRGTFSINKAMHILYSFYEELNTRRKQTLSHKEDICS